VKKKNPGPYVRYQVFQWRPGQESNLSDSNIFKTDDKNQAYISPFGRLCYYSPKYTTCKWLQELVTNFWMVPAKSGGSACDTCVGSLARKFLYTTVQGKTANITPGGATENKFYAKYSNNL